MSKRRVLHYNIFHTLRFARTGRPSGGCRLGGTGMRPRSSAIVALLALTAVSWTGVTGVAVSQPARLAAVGHPIPQSLVFEHEQTLNRLSILAQRPGDVGVVARKALVVF